jgi:hypothetical protein
MTEAPVQLASALRSGFGNAMWLAILIHVIALEVYASTWNVRAQLSLTYL